MVTEQEESAPGSLHDTSKDKRIPDTKVFSTTFASTTAAAILSDHHIQVDDIIYDTAQIAVIHPGGDLFLKTFSGRDATSAFISIHRRKFPHKRMSHAAVGIPSNLANASDHDVEFFALCKLIDEAVPRCAFAPPIYYVKVVFLTISAVALEGYIHYTKSYFWYLTSILGLLYAWIFLNHVHEGNHGAISRYGLVNRIIGMSQNWIGGSAVDWCHQHNVLHHIFPNDVEHDPDVAGNDLLRLNPMSVLKNVHKNQHIYFFVLCAFFVLLMTALHSMKHNIQRFHQSKMSVMLASNHLFEEVTIVLFLFRWILLPVLLKPSVLTFINVLPLFIVGGYYLSFFLIISHNFDGVYMYEPDNAPISFLRLQVASSSNLCGYWLSFFNGGANYQIEHHLFPRMNSEYFHIVAPIVRTYCESKGIRYVHFESIWDNVLATSRHLHQLGVDGGTGGKPVGFNHLLLPGEEPGGGLGPAGHYSTDCKMNKNKSE